MALLGSKKNKKSETAVVVVKSETTSSVRGLRDVTNILMRPRITEKSSMKSENNIYAFDVSRTANKKVIAQAVKMMYKVTPIKVAVVTIPTKNVFVRGKWGTKGGGKKAYIYLKKGETIEFV